MPKHSRKTKPFQTPRVTKSKTLGRKRACRTCPKLAACEASARWQGFTTGLPQLTKILGSLRALLILIREVMAFAG